MEGETLYVSYEDGCGFEASFNLTIDDPHISYPLNLFVSVLKAMGYRDETIEKYICSTYFTKNIFN